MQHRGHKLAAIGILLAGFLLPFAIARAASRTNNTQAYLDGSGMQHVYSTNSQTVLSGVNVMESIAGSVGLNAQVQ